MLEWIEPEPPAVTERVADYPRPPRLEPVARRLRVVFDGRTIADTTRGMRVLETNHPPTYYFPPGDVDTSVMVATPSRTWCEWKGRARYWSLHAGDAVAVDAAWTYPTPARDFAAIAGWFAFYPARVDACLVDDEQVDAQQSSFYGGWITADIEGPFKGPPGTAGW